jgi:hypothetical protein
MALRTRIWHLPLVVASFVFYRCIRLLLKGVIALHRRSRRGKPPTWQSITGETIQKPLILPTIIATAPRWNPHAVTASLGPFEVQKQLKIDLATVKGSAPVWTVVVNAFPSLQTATALSSLKPTQTDADSGTVSLEPGLYMLALRYYRGGTTQVLPAVEVDGTPLSPAQPLPLEPNAYFHSLRSRETGFYRALQYYLYAVLELRERQPDGFVYGEYLPQPNPETRFFFGHFQRGERLELQLKPGLRDTCAVYLTCYDRASFPLRWYEVTEDWHRSEPLEEDGTWLIRVVREVAGAQDAPPDAVRVERKAG